MRNVLLCLMVALVTASLSCQSCPDGNAGNSLFCHAANCSSAETICAGACANLQSDRDNCGACGKQCGDGLVCSAGACVEGCASGQVNCAGSCVDTAADKNNCGGCSADSSVHMCTADQTCNSGTCGCGPADIVCNGTCTNPKTSATYCGASGTCTGASAGTMCSATEACLNGACTSRLIYRGSLPASTGRWTYRGTLGITGANADCAAHWPGSEICTYTKLLAASMKAVPETLNATDYNNQPVTEWWIDDSTVGGTQRCQSNADAIPWSYATADQGHVGKYVTLNRGTGVIGALTTEGLPSCNKARFVACCSTVTAP